MRPASSLISVTCVCAAMSVCAGSGSQRLDKVPRPAPSSAAQNHFNRNDPTVTRALKAVVHHNASAPSVGVSTAFTQTRNKASYEGFGSDRPQVHISTGHGKRKATSKRRSRGYTKVAAALDEPQARGGYSEGQLKRAGAPQTFVQKISNVDHGNIHLRVVDSDDGEGGTEITINDQGLRARDDARGDSQIIQIPAGADESDQDDVPKASIQEVRSHVRKDLASNAQVRAAKDRASTLQEKLQLQEKLKERETLLNRLLLSRMHQLHAVEKTVRKLVAEMNQQLNEAKENFVALKSDLESIAQEFTLELDSHLKKARQHPGLRRESLDLQSEDCPQVCNSTHCANQRDAVANCFKVVEDKPGVFECVAFEDAQSAKCPQGYRRCSAPVLDPGQVVKVVANKDSQIIAITGSNLHRCLELFVVKSSTSCEAENIARMAAESGHILSGGPRIPSAAVVKKIAMYTQFQMRVPGTYRLCLAQYSQQNSSSSSAALLSSELAGKLEVIDER